MKVQVVNCVCGAKLNVPIHANKFRCVSCNRVHEWYSDFYECDMEKSSRSIKGYLGRGHKVRRLNNARIQLS